MKTKVLRKVLAIVIVCLVAFGANVISFAADTPVVPGVSATEDAAPAEMPEPEELPEATETQDPTDKPEQGTAEVTFEVNNGTAVSPKTVTIGDAIGELPATTKKGCTFKGWYTAKSGGEKVTEETIVTEAVTYYARWTANKYVAMFDPNGGKIGGGGTKKITQTYGKKYTLPAEPVRTGYTFKGWYTAKSGGSKISASSTVKIVKTTRIYARWTAKKYTAVYNANGGKIGANATQKIRQTYGKKYILPAKPVRDGYTFKGWYTAKTDGTKITTASTVKLTKNKTFYAQWEQGMPANADIVVETKINLTGSGTGWHGKLVIQDGNTAVSFGIQHDTRSGIGPKNQDYLMFESVRNSPGYHSYTGYKAVSTGWHTIRLEYYQSQNKARGYCDGEFIAEVNVMPIQKNYISVNKEAIPRVTGDTVDAQFKNMFVYSKTYWYNGHYDHQQYGTFRIEKSADLPSKPYDSYIYNEQGETWRMYGTASIPNGGDWDSYPTVGVRKLFNFVKR